TAILLTISFLIMLFSSGEKGFRTTYFGSLFFNSKEKDSGTLSMELGIINFWPILVTIVILTVVIFLFIKLFVKKNGTK
ncbi:hypothetical protein, partial [Staphylococcus pseudintermedius]